MLRPQSLLPDSQIISQVISQVTVVLLAWGSLACSGGDTERRDPSSPAPSGAQQVPGELNSDQPDPNGDASAPTTTDPVSPSPTGSTSGAGDLSDDVGLDETDEAAETMADASVEDVGDTEDAAAPADAAGHDAGLPIESVRIIRGDPNETFVSLTLFGNGLTEHEGKDVHVRLGRPDRPPERLATGYTRIVDGAFRLAFPDSNELGLYKERLVFIDVDSDGTCSDADSVHGDWRALLEDAVLSLSDSTPSGTLDAIPPTSGRCDVFNEPWPEE